MKRLLVLVFSSLFSLTAAADAGGINVDNVLRLMNAERAARGVAPLRIDARLTLAAEDRMRHMEEDGYWSHESPDGMSPFVWLAPRAYEHRFAAENLAAGFETSEVLVQAWMESPGHRGNIISPNYEDCGIAIIDGATTGPAVGKSIVVLFGARKHERSTAASTSRR